MTLDRAAAGVPKLLVLDFTAVSFSGSVCLAILIKLDEASQERGVSLHIVATGVVRRLLELTGMDQVLPAYKSLDEALQPGR